MVEYEVHAHVMGRDYQICEQSVKFSMRDACETLSIVCEDGMLERGSDYTIIWDEDGGLWGAFVFHTLRHRCMILSYDTEGNLKRSPVFDVVLNVIVTDRSPHAMTHQALARLLREVHETKKHTQQLLQHCNDITRGNSLESTIDPSSDVDAEGTISEVSLKAVHPKRQPPRSRTMSASG